MSGRFFTEVHRRPTKRLYIRDSRSMINNPRSPSPSSFASIRGSIISLKASAPLGRNALLDKNPSLPSLCARKIEFLPQHRRRIKHFRVRASHSHGGERLIEVHTKKREQKSGRATGPYLAHFAVNQHGFTIMKRGSHIA